MSEIELKRYPLYKETEVQWLGEIPEHWEFRKLKYLAVCLPSNVDKHIRVREESVRLCNYTDVYKNDFITDDLEFMIATASKEQIKNFSLSEGDVLITKDSETAQDIAVPSFVSERLNNVVCGYHLAIIRPKSRIYGKYLYRAFQSKVFNLQFSICSKGITRVGLGISDLKRGYFLIPPPLEQKAIAQFLDRKAALIDQAISIKAKQIQLLNERLQILIHQAVTRGLNSHVKMKDSGEEWIGKIPDHWELKKNRSLFIEKNLPGNDNLPTLSVSIHTGVSSEELGDNENLRGKIRIEDKGSYKFVQPGFIAYNMMRAWQGGIGAVRTEGMVSPAYVVAEANKRINTNYFEYLYRTHSFIQQMDRNSKGITDFRKRLYWDEFKRLITIVPPIDEQFAIVEYIDGVTRRIIKVIELKEEEINKLKEFKSSLIDGVVTGKIKVF
jgi:type I restriction enzyme S subunit